MTRSRPAQLAGAMVYVALAWGFSFLLIRQSLEATGPFGVALARAGIGAAILWLIPASRRRVPLRDHPPLLLLALVWMAIPMVLFPVAEEHLDSAAAGIINGSAPLFTAAMAAIGTRVAPSRRRLLGLVLGFGGVLLICLPAMGSNAALPATSVGYVLVAVILYGVAFNLTGPLQRRHGALPVVARSLTISALLLFPVGGGQLAIADATSPGMLSLIALGTLNTGLAFAAFTWLAGRTDPTRASVVTYAVPAISAIAGTSIAHESLPPTAYLGLPIVILGALLTQRSPALHQSIRQ